MMEREPDLPISETLQPLAGPLEAQLWKTGYDADLDTILGYDLGPSNETVHTLVEANVLVNKYDARRATLQEKANSEQHLADPVSDTREARKVNAQLGE